jgi:hypothetical protein
MPNTDLRFKEEIEVDPIHQDWNEQQQFVPTRNSDWVPAPPKKPNQC